MQFSLHYGPAIPAALAFNSKCFIFNFYMSNALHKIATCDGKPIRKFDLTCLPSLAPVGQLWDFESICSLSLGVNESEIESIVSSVVPNFSQMIESGCGFLEQRDFYKLSSVLRSASSEFYRQNFNEMKMFSIFIGNKIKINRRECQIMYSMAYGFPYVLELVMLDFREVTAKKSLLVGNDLRIFPGIHRVKLSKTSGDMIKVEIDDFLSVLISYDLSFMIRGTNAD
jgi:hypothetical protein